MRTSSSKSTLVEMYIRIVWGKLRWGTWHQYERHYHERVAPLTKDFRGLRERQLLRGIDNPDEGISLSLWDTREALHDYEVSDTRRELAQEVEHLYHPWSYSGSEYLVKHFEVLSSPAWSGLQEGYLRIVWGKLRPGSWEEYQLHYTGRVSTSAESIRGLQGRQLLRSVADPDEGISVSIWDTVDDLLNYERSAFRQSLAKEVEHLYREDYWVKHFMVITDNR